MQRASSLRPSVYPPSIAVVGRMLGVVLCAAAVLPPGETWIGGSGDAWAQQDVPAESTRIQSGFIDVDGGRLFYEEAGHGDCIVLVHDGLIHHEIWDAQFPVFAQTHRVVRYDRRGYGKSESPEGQYSNIADLRRVFEQLGIERAWLMGMSAGGGLCIDFTLAYPEMVTGLVLVGAVVSGFDYTQHMYTRGGRLTAAIYGDPEALRLYMVTTDPYEMAPSSTAARARARALLEAYPGNADLEKHHLAVSPDTPALGRLGEIRVPALILVGEHDIPDVHAHAGAIDAGIPDARRVVVSGAGHLVPLEAPASFLSEAQAFLRGAHFFATLAEEGVAAAVAEFAHSRQTHPDEAPFTEGRLNNEAYQRIQSGRVDEAIELFKLNVQAYPESWNVYDSLAEGYMTRGDTALAITYYEKSLELNPDNTGARQRIEELRGGR
ncbi:alpha/beta fold hydrolase [Candidatus Eisenbacteria bacterium]|uniref:Alpha/beta fold hydrolase n=1 Tax=Eiseniibacteriota bacterium TaxID=2212470 RepID=A0ABV6YIJ5_UNCEI